jgi:predicted RNA binding protein YcfA (HicA-like mRNA interferase family)
MGQGLKTLSTKDVLKIFSIFGFTVHSQNGSHIKLRRLTLSQTQTIIVPEKKTMRDGTLRAIIRQASVYIPGTELHSHFYNE